MNELEFIALEIFKEIKNWLVEINHRLDALETAVGDLQGTDEQAAYEQAAWERFNTRFENLPEQGGPECPDGYFWNGRQCLREGPWPSMSLGEREG